MKSVLFLVVLVFVGSIASAQNRTFTNTAIIQNGTPIPFAIGNSNILEDLNYTAAKVPNYFSYDPIYWIEFKYDKKSNIYYYNAPFTAKVKLNVNYWYYGATNPSGSQAVELDLNFDPNDASKNNFLSYQLINPNATNKIVKVEFTVLSGTNLPTGSIANLFSVSANYLVNYRASVNFTTITNISHTINGSKFNVSWNKSLTGSNTLLCDEFDFEWAFKDGLSSISNADIKEFSRLTTSNLNVSNIPLLYNNGNIVYRIREVYYDYVNNRIEGPWSALQSFSFTQGHEPKLNWVSSISFAEEAKHKEVITYYDGAQRDRQSVTFNTTDAKPVIAESYYDYEGRKAASILPAPHLSQSDIKFYRNFNVDNVTSKPYQATNFSNLVNCSTPPTPLSTASGASMYYSGNNSLKTTKFHSFIPNANGYPLTTIEYANDNTGRITRQSGVGNLFQFGSGRETKYYYAKAFQEEIDRLFGTDVGYDEHYFKNLVLDANGQFSISYLDMAGKTIATSLAGEASNPAIMINDNNTGPFPMTYKFFKPTSFKHDFRNAKNIAFLKHVVTGTQTMKFYVQNDSASHNDTCRRTTCSDCYYDFEINVKSTCITDAQDKKFKLRNYNLQGVDSVIVMDTSCNTMLKSLNDSFDLLMPSGEYDVHATVSIPEKVISFYTNRYLEDGACFPDLDSLKRKHRARMTRCITNCQECLDEYGNVETTVNRMMARLIADGQKFNSIQDSLDMRATLKQSADSAKEGCRSYCEPINICDVTYKAMLADVSPGGQYAMWYDTTNMAYYSKSGTPTNPSKPRPSWKLHDSRVTVFKTANFNNSSNPIKRKDGSNFVLNTSEGLRTLSDEWDKSFAEILVKYHPEYCYYEYCANNSAYQKFMDSLEEIDKWSTAVTKGFINTTTLANSIDNMVNRNPYFAGGANNKSDVLDSLHNFYKFLDPISGSPIFTFNILDMAILQTNYKLISQNPGSPNITINYAYLDTSSCDGLKNMVWINFKNLYKHVVNYQYEKNREVSCPGIRLLEIGKCNKDLKGIDKKGRFFNFLTGSNPTINFPHCVKTPRFFRTYEMKLTFMDYINSNIASSSAAGAAATAAAEYQESCDTNCAAMAEGWVSILEHCLLKPGLSMDDLKADLIRICQASCVDPLYKHPFGARSTPPGVTIMVRGVPCTSFDEVIDQYYDPSIPYNNRACDANLITYPKNFGTTTYFEQRVTITKIDSCVCANIAQYEQEYNQYLLSPPNPVNPNVVSFYTYLKEYYPDEFTMVEEDYDIMYGSCHNQDTLCTYLEKEVFIPYLFECFARISCSEFNIANTAFKAKYTDLDETEEEYRRFYRGFMNARFGMDASYDDYVKFKDKCDDCMENDTVDCITFNKLLNNFLVYRKSIDKPWPGTRENNYLSLTRWINTNYAGNLSVQYIIKMLKQCRPEYAAGDCDEILDIFFDFRTEFKRNFVNDMNLNAMSMTNLTFLRDYFNDRLNRTPKYSNMDIVNLLNNCGVHIKPVLKCDEFSAFFFGAYDVTFNSTLGTSSGPCVVYDQNTLFRAINKHFGTEFTQGYIDSLFKQCISFIPADCHYGGCNIDCSKYDTVVKRFMNSAFADGITFPVSNKKDYYSFLTKFKNYYNNFSENVGGEKNFDSFYWKNGRATGSYTEVGGKWTQYCMINELMLKKLISYCDTGKCSKYCDSSGYINCSELYEYRKFYENTLLGASYTLEDLKNYINDHFLIIDTISLDDITGFDNECLDCGEVNNFLLTYPNTPNPLFIPLSASFLNSFSAYIPLSHYNMSKNELAILIERCKIDTPMNVSLPVYFPQPKCDSIYMHNKPLSPRMKPINECEDQQEKLALSAALEEYNKLRQDAVQDFRRRYIEKCLKSANTRVTAKGICNEFHFTLYYYGQDGNLLKTVPPAGVAPITSNNLYLPEAQRKAGNSYLPSHTLPTEYKYNSLNQVYEQTTPDAGTSRFAYDILGRLLFSQNAEQAIVKNDKKKYSYTIYDDLGRIAESGEIEVPNYAQFDYLFSVNYTDYSYYLNLLNVSKANATFRYVTRTYYDQNMFSYVAPEFTNGLQENLRNRIASITLDTLDTDKGADPSTYQTALHYTYDILGNVQTLVTDNNLLGGAISNQRFKKLDYDYDLVSGKVNKVSYQKARPDQFFYRYRYDAENRITSAETSVDDIYWNKDANYEYYLHGPLARTVLGEDQVQGVDYAYNLQGWLKSINASTLNAAYDMGKDGHVLAGNPNATTARDAVALSLRYFSNDYSQIYSSGNVNPIEASLPSGMTGLDNNLWNGNISSQTVSLKGLTAPTFAYQYRYDQLNRLVKMDAYEPSSVASNDISNASTTAKKYAESIKYDPNGNILKYNRRNHLGVMMDSLTYNYDAIKRNQLKQVQDAVGNAVSDKDIDNQLKSKNYLYDAIGNLIVDSSENLKISWTPTGKIAHIIQGNKNLKLTFAYDPMGNRISKTITYLTGTLAPQTTYYTRDAQGNTMAVYDNHFEGLGEVPCEFNEDDIKAFLQLYYTDIISTVIDPNINTDFQPFEMIVNQYKNSKLAELGTSCHDQARGYIISRITATPDPITYPLSGFWVVSQIKTEVENNYQSMTLQDLIDHVKQNVFPGEDPSAVEEWVKFFWNIYNFNNPNNTIYSEITNQGYTYINHTVKNVNDSLYWREQHLYGSSRLGMHLPDKEVAKYNLPNTVNSSYYTGMRQYELTNHLGNVLSTIKDEKKQIQQGTSGLVSYYEPIVQNATDYYPFGMPMPNRTYSLSSSKYRFGFNTQEKDDEIYGEGNLMSAEFWEYDTRIGRRWNVDPRPNISVSTYAVFGNNPIIYSDSKGDTLRGSSELSAERVKSVITSTFKGEKFDELNKLFKIGKDGITFNKIKRRDFKNATKDLSSDEKALAKGYYDAVNDFETHTVAVLLKSENVDQVTADRELYMNMYGAITMETTGQDISAFAGGGANYRQSDGTFTLLIQNSSTRLPYIIDGKRVTLTCDVGETFAHELIGHGLSMILSIYDNDNIAIQVGNLYRRVLGQPGYRNGEEHGNWTKKNPIEMKEDEANEVPSHIK